MDQETDRDEFLFMEPEGHRVGFLGIGGILAQTSSGFGEHWDGYFYPTGGLPALWEIQPWNSVTATATRMPSSLIII